MSVRKHFISVSCRSGPDSFVASRRPGVSGPGRRSDLVADLMPMVHAERQSLSDFLATLTPDQWSHATWCHKWNVQELVGHLTAAGNITAPHFFGGFVRSGFNF